MQRRLDEYFKQPTIRVHPSSPKSNLIEITHRDLIICLLQLGIAFTEKSLLRALKNEITVLRAKGRQVAPITLEKLRQQLHQLAREKLVEKIGYCWRMPY